MKYKGQIGLEVMIGGIIFLLFFLAVSTYLFSENNEITNNLIEIEKEKKCKEFSQVLFEVKNNSLTWEGTIDHNIYINDSTLLLNYNPPTPFNGVFCNTISTNLTSALTKGDVNVSYSIDGGYNFEQ